MIYNFLIESQEQKQSSYLLLLIKVWQGVYFFELRTNISWLVFIQGIKVWGQVT